MTKRIKSLLADAARDVITVNINAEKRKISKLHTMAMNLATKAMGGDAKSLRLMLDWFEQIETRTFPS